MRARLRHPDASKREDCSLVKDCDDSESGRIGKASDYPLRAAREQTKIEGTMEDCSPIRLFLGASKTRRDATRHDTHAVEQPERNVRPG